MTFAAIAVGVAATAIGTGVSAGMSSKAAADSKKQYKQALNAANSIYGQNNQQLQNYYRPYIKAGNQDLRLLQAALSPVGQADYSMPEAPGAAPDRRQMINQGLQKWNPEGGGGLASMVARRR